MKDLNYSTLVSISFHSSTIAFAGIMSQLSNAEYTGPAQIDARKMDVSKPCIAISAPNSKI